MSIIGDVLSVRSEHTGHIVHTISVINAKGGVGKTSTVLHLAVASVQDGLNTAILDLDPQATCVHWSDRRSESTPVVLAVSVGRLREELERVAAAGADVVYLDTPPRWAGSDTAARAAARVSDTMIVPTRPSIVDLEATMDTIERIRNVSTARVVAVLNGCLSRGRDAAGAAAALAGRNVEVCPVRIGQRVVIARALLHGRAAQEVEPGGKAANEIASVYSVLSAHIEHTTSNGKGNI